jgi:hypothetical protein
MTPRVTCIHENERKSTVYYLSNIHFFKREKPTCSIRHMLMIKKKEIFNSFFKFNYKLIAQN